MRRILLLALFTFFSAAVLFAQSRKLRAFPASEPVKVDGILNEGIWQQVPEAGGFIQNRPVPGKLETHKTEVKVVYDNIAIYIGATLYDSSADSILRQLVQ
jgi:hypothetical protein